MSDYISRQAAFEALEKRGVSTTNISRVPIADVRENVKGKWIDSIANLYDKKHVYKQCSNCGAGFIYGVVMPKRPDGKIPVHTQFHNYCPNCGAQMIRGES